MDIKYAKREMDSIFNYWVNNIESIIGFENNSYTENGFAYEIPIFNYEDNIYYIIRNKINDSIYKMNVEVIDICLNERYKLVCRGGNIEGFALGINCVIEEKENGKRIGVCLNTINRLHVKMVDLNKTFKSYNISEVIGIQQIGGEIKEQYLIEENEFFDSHQMSLKNMLMKDFFRIYSDDELYKCYEDNLMLFYKRIKFKMGIKVIPVLTSVYTPRFLEKVKNELLNYGYGSARYIFLEKDIKSSEKKNLLKEEKNIQKIKNYIKNHNIIKIDNIIKQYKDDQYYRLMLGDFDFAKSFSTSEWLYYSIDKNGEFDYTAIVTGYLKSIEQLLYFIMHLEMGEEDKKVSIKIKYLNDVLDITKRVAFYYHKKDDNHLRNDYYLLDTRSEVLKDKTGKPWSKDVFVPFYDEVDKYIKDTMADYIYYIRFQSEALNCSGETDRSNKRLICDIVDCFRDECRNGYFHTHIINSWDEVEKIRNNAFYIYCLLLGSLSENCADIIERMKDRITKKNNLYASANAFKQAILFQRAIKGCLVGDMKNYPYKCSILASLYLKKYLCDYHNAETTLKIGDCTLEDETISHAWLETRDGIVIDITCDQFIDRDDKLFCDKSIYIGEYNSFYSIFDVHDSSVDEQEFYSEDNNQENYKSIMDAFSIINQKNEE